MPRVFLPTGFKSRMKRDTAKTTIGIEIERKIAIEGTKLNPIMGLRKNIRKRFGTSWKREETKTLACPAEDEEDSTNSLRISAPQKPRRKPLSQILESLRTALSMPPRKVTANHVEEEKRDRP